MRPETLAFYDELEQDIRNAYERPVETDEAQLLASKFLLAQLNAGRELSNLNLDARMKKTGLKALKAQVYLKHAQTSLGEKKPTEATLSAIVDSDKLVLENQDMFDKAEVERDLIENYLNVFREAHIFMRSLSKGKFE